LSFLLSVVHPWLSARPNYFKQRRRESFEDCVLRTLVSLAETGHDLIARRLVQQQLCRSKLANALGSWDDLQQRVYWMPSIRCFRCRRCVRRCCAAPSLGAYENVTDTATGASGWR